MPAPYENSRTQVLIQEGGSGNAVQVTPPEVILQAPSGGGYTYESDFSKPIPAGYVGTRKTSNPARVTFTILDRMYTDRVITKLDRLKDQGCLFNVYVLEGCEVEDNVSFAGFNKGYVFIDGGPTNGQGVADNPLADRQSGSNPKMNNQTAVDAAIARILIPSAVNDISGTVAQSAINKVIPLGGAQCAGICGLADDGNQQFIMVTDARGGGYTYPQLFYTDDAGKTWVTNNLTTIADGAAVDVTVAGNTVLIAATGTDAGLYYDTLENVKLGNAVGTAVGGSAIVAGTTAINAVRAITGTFVIAVGQAGAIYESFNGGFSFTQIGSGVTAENLTDIAGASEYLVWITGENGVLLRYKNQNAVSLVTVDSSLAAVDLTSVDVPKGRANEVYVGAANGDVWRTRQANNTTPTFEELDIPKPASSRIEELRFGGIKGLALWLVQTNGSNQSRILRDLSGGNLAYQTVALSQFDTPSNAVLNSIAPSDHNNALSGGEVDSTYAAIFKAG